MVSVGEGGTDLAEDGTKEEGGTGEEGNGEVMRGIGEGVLEEKGSAGGH